MIKTKTYRTCCLTKPGQSLPITFTFNIHKVWMTVGRHIYSLNKPKKLTSGILSHDSVQPSLWHSLLDNRGCIRGKEPSRNKRSSLKCIYDVIKDEVNINKNHPSGSPSISQIFWYSCSQVLESSPVKWFLDSSFIDWPVRSKSKQLGSGFWWWNWRGFRGRLL